jgi:hypothetical protein
MSALRADRPLPSRKIPGIHVCYRHSRPQDHSAAGRIRPTEKSNDLIGNRTRDLPACSIVPQPTTLPLAPVRQRSRHKEFSKSYFHQNLHFQFKNCFDDSSSRSLSAYLSDTRIFARLNYLHVDLHGISVTLLRVNKLTWWLRTSLTSPAFKKQFSANFQHTIFSQFPTCDVFFLKMSWILLKT